MPAASDLRVTVEQTRQIDESLTDMAQPVPRPDATTRREFAGMITHLDEAVRDISNAMETAGLWCGPQSQRVNEPYNRNAHLDY